MKLQTYKNYIPNPLFLGQKDSKHEADKIVSELSERFPNRSLCSFYARKELYRGDIEHLGCYCHIMAHLALGVIDQETVDAIEKFADEILCPDGVGRSLKPPSDLQ